MNGISIRQLCDIARSLGLRPRNVLEIGARLAEDSTTIARAFAIPDQRVFVVEPNPDLHPELRALHPRYRLFACAIAAEAGTVRFHKMRREHHIDEVGRSSLLNRTDALYQLHADIIEVPAITGRDLLAQIDLPAVDLMKLDVEGLAWEVLHSFGDDLKRVRLIHLEAEHRQVWQGQRLFADVQALMLAQGFRMVQFGWAWGGNEQSDSVWFRDAGLPADSELPRSGQRD